MIPSIINTGRILLILFSMISVFHLLALTGIVPMKFLWGGRLTSSEELVVMETVSLLLNLLMASLVLIRIKRIFPRIPEALVRWTFFGLGLLFALNTVGNLMAKTDLEKWAGTPATFVLSLLCFRMARKERTDGVRMEDA